jgi:restriction system protein
MKMAIPDFQTLMLPVLTFSSDQQEHATRETVDTLAQQLQLSQAERAELLPSGQQARFDNRVAWAISYLKRAVLLESTRRGYFRISERGLQVLRQSPQRIDMKFLLQFPEYVQFKERETHERNGKASQLQVEESNPQTPEELLESSYLRIRQELAQEILGRVKACPPSFFERLVVELLVKMGYGGSRKDAGEAIGRSGDEGIDGIIKEDRLGLDTIYIQAKRWQGVVGRPEIHRFAGALLGQRARKGIFITTSDFTREAREYASNIESKIVLIDGDQLAHMMMDFDVGVARASVYEIKRIDSDYFNEI